MNSSPSLSPQAVVIKNKLNSLNSHRVIVMSHAGPLSLLKTKLNVELAKFPSPNIPQVTDALGFDSADYSPDHTGIHVLSKTDADPKGNATWKTVVFILPKKEPSSFALHTAVRKHLQALFPTFSNAPVRVSISVESGLADSLQKQWVDAVVSFAHLTRFQTEVFGQKKKKQKAPSKVELFFSSEVKTFADVVHRAQVLALSNNRVRYLGELPSNVLNPSTYQAHARALARELKVGFEVLPVAALKRLKAHAFTAVVQADPKTASGIVRLKYKPKTKSRGRLAIVGKGLCFDTGGYNVKTGSFMYNMHRDMYGSAVALGLFETLVRLRAPYEITLHLALAENLISPTAYRPNDVVVASNGIAIEVIDTDAEGRMVLSDTLALAAREKPDFMIDFATLTGACVRAIDTKRCGAFSNDDATLAAAVAAGVSSGERVVGFPIGDDYEDGIKSQLADVRQCAVGNAADHIYAATFLSKFVPANIPWVHVDLSADTTSGGLGLVPTEATGFGVRFGLELIESVM